MSAAKVCKPEARWRRVVVIIVALYDLEGSSSLSVVPNLLPEFFVYYYVLKSISSLPVKFLHAGAPAHNRGGYQTWHLGKYGMRDERRQRSIGFHEAVGYFIASTMMLAARLKKSAAVSVRCRP